MKEKLEIYTFDMDENLLFTGEVIFLLDKLKNKKIAVLQDEYYKCIKDKERYEHINNNIEESMINFRKNDWYLEKQLISVYEKWISGDKESVWPSWNVFIQALEDKAPIAIITARWHNVKEFEKAFTSIIKRLIKDKFLKENNYKTYFECIDFYPVSNRILNEKEGIPFEQHPSVKKNYFFKKFLNDTIKKYGKDYKKFTIGFSDDSRSNIIKMIEFILDNNEKNSNSKDWIEVEYNFYDTWNRNNQRIKIIGKLF